MTRPSRSPFRLLLPTFGIVVLFLAALLLPATLTRAQDPLLDEFAPPPLTSSTSSNTSGSVTLGARLDRTTGETFVVQVKIPRGFHAQSDQPLTKNLIAFTVTPVATPGATFGAPVFPKAEVKNYPVIGEQSVFGGELEIRVPVTIAGDAKPPTLAADVRYQVCNDQGSCFPPETKRITLNLADGTSTTGAPMPPSNAGQPQTNGGGVAIGSGLAPVPVQSVPAALLTAILAGLIFNVMPCVLPVLPLKAVGFYKVAHEKRGKSMLYGLVFALGMISVFAILGVLIFPLTLIDWGEVFSKPWFIWPIVILLLLMGLGLLNVFEIALPMKTYSFAPRHDTFGGNFVWGGFTAILATPCTAPLLPGVLLWAAQQSSVVAVLCMVFVGVGMALPYLILSGMPEVARKLPQTGPWSLLFKQMMGLLVIASAVYFASGRLIHGPNFWVPVFGVVVVAAVFLMIRTVQLSGGPRALVVNGVIAAALVGGMGYWTDTVTRNANQWTAFATDDFDRARRDRIVLVKFTANWCTTCQWIEGNVYTKDDVWKALDGLNVHAIKADLTDSSHDAAHDPRPLLHQLTPAGGIPLTAIFAPGRSEPIVLSTLYSDQELIAALRSLDARAAAN